MQPNDIVVEPRPEPIGRWSRARRRALLAVGAVVVVCALILSLTAGPGAVSSSPKDEVRVVISFDGRWCGYILNSTIPGCVCNTSVEGTGPTTYTFEKGPDNWGSPVYVHAEIHKMDGSNETLTLRIEVDHIDDGFQWRVPFMTGQTSDVNGTASASYANFVYDG